MSTNTWYCDQPYTGWKDVWYCISPNSWGYVGVAMALFFSVIGAAWYAITSYIICD